MQDAVLPNQTRPPQKLSLTQHLPPPGTLSQSQPQSHLFQNAPSTSRRRCSTRVADWSADLPQAPGSTSFPACGRPVTPQKRVLRATIGRVCASLQSHAARRRELLESQRVRVAEVPDGSGGRRMGGLESDGVEVFLVRVHGLCKRVLFGGGY
jgi:hypothetical protein